MRQACSPHHAYLAEATVAVQIDSLMPSAIYSASQLAQRYPTTPMDVRKDFLGVEPLLQRLAGIGAQFARYNDHDWPHMNNREDFQKIYLLPQDQWIQLEDLYAKGRECAAFMGDRLREFNNVGEFPTFADYVDSFTHTWAYKHENLELFIIEIKALTKKLDNPPWAVRRMIDLFESQLKLLAAVRHSIAILKQSHTYLVDKGEAPMEKPNTISIGTVTGRININSIDNSQNHHFNASSVFPGLAAAISNAEIEEEEKAQLLMHIEALKKAEGSTGFVERYKEFMQNAANHISVVGPFLPALSALLG